VEGYLQAGPCDLVALAREVMWNPNWPAHAAAGLGGDALALPPPSFAGWLEKREEARRRYPPGAESAA